MTTRTKRLIKFFLENKVEEFKWRETIRKEDPTFKDSRGNIVNKYNFVDDVLFYFQTVNNS